MNFNNRIAKWLCPLVVAAFQTGAHAAAPDYAPGDIFMGFRTDSDPGSSTCLIVNIGPAARYRDATAVITLDLAGTVAAGGVGADLVETYGADWRTRSDLFWGISGTSSNVETIADDPVGTLYASRVEATAGVAPTAWTVSSQTNRTSASTRMKTLSSTFLTEVASVNSSVAVLQSVNTSNSWRSYMSPGGANGNTANNAADFGVFSNIEGNPNKTMALFRLTSAAAGTYLGSFSMSNAGVLTFTPANLPSTYTLTLGSTTNGAVTGAGSYNSGATATLTATPNAGYLFTGWTGDASGTTNPLQVTMSGNKTIGATFVPAVVQYTLTTPSASNGIISGAGTYDSGATATLTATPNAGYLFTGWTGDATGSTNPLQVTMSANKSISANFTRIQHLVSITTPSNGQIEGAGTYDYGSSVTLTATPAQGYRFTGWTGDASGTTNPLSFELTANRTIGATFAPIVIQYTVAATQPQNGNITGAGTYDSGTSVTLTAVPATGYYFTGWTGDASGTQNPLSFSLTGNKTIGASFARISYVVAVNAENGNVSGAGSYESGSTATLTATANANYSFAGWSGDATGTTNPLLVTVDAAKNITANFARLQYAVTTVANANGTISGAGTYDSGAVATLTATPKLGYVFSGWSGSASGNSNPLSVTVNGVKSISAIFIKDLSDADGDGITAYDELVLYNSVPGKIDSDANGLPDRLELALDDKLKLTRTLPLNGLFQEDYFQGSLSQFRKVVLVSKLPPGLVYNKKTGVISGAVKRVGDYEIQFAITRKDNSKRNLVISVKVTSMDAYYDRYIAWTADGKQVLTTVASNGLASAVVTNLWAKPASFVLNPEFKTKDTPSSGVQAKVGSSMVWDFSGTQVGWAGVTAKSYGTLNGSALQGYRISTNPYLLTESFDNLNETAPLRQWILTKGNQTLTISGSYLAARATVAWKMTASRVGAKSMVFTSSAPISQEGVVGLTVQPKGWDRVMGFVQIIKNGQESYDVELLNGFDGWALQQP